MSSKSINQLLKYLEDRMISANDALEIIKKNTEVNPNNQRSVWKALRLGMYIRQRYYEWEQGLLGKKADSVRRVIDKPEFERLAATFNTSKKLDKEREFKLLNHLITDPRQQGFFILPNIQPKDRKVMPKLNQKLLNELVGKKEEK